MDQLQKELQYEITKKVTEDFKDPLGPLNALTTAALAPLGKADWLRFIHIDRIKINIPDSFVCANLRLKMEKCLEFFFLKWMGLTYRRIQ